MFEEHRCSPTDSCHESVGLMTNKQHLTQVEGGGTTERCLSYGPILQHGQCCCQQPAVLTSHARMARARTTITISNATKMPA